MRGSNGAQSGFLLRLQVGGPGTPSGRGGGRAKRRRRAGHCATDAAAGSGGACTKALAVVSPRRRCIRHQTSTSVTSLLTPPIPRSHPVIHVRCNSALVQVAINHANQFQIQYLTSASELAHIRTVRNGVLYLVYRRLRARIPFTRKFALLRTHTGFHCSVPSLYALVAAAPG